MDAFLRCQVGRVAAFLSLLLPALPVWAAPQLSISPLGYRIERVAQVPNAARTYDVTARAGVANTGDTATNVAARLTSSTTAVTVLDGDVSFGNVAKTQPLKPVVSADTFKLRFVLPSNYSASAVLTHVQTVANGLSWSISCGNCGQNRAPLANAGAAQSVYVGQWVTLDGSASSDADGNALAYRWSIASKPTGSAITLSDSVAVKPTFTPDKEGDYVFQLVVNDGRVDSAPATVTVTTLNSAPIANAGTDQTARVGTPVYLNGAASTDIDGDALTYQWTIVSRPAGSVVALLNTDPASPLTDFVIDRAGTYLIELVVNDGTISSTPDSIVVSTLNSSPVADAGSDQTAPLLTAVQLSGAGSNDVDGDALTYRWSLTPPVDSQAVLTTSIGRDTNFVVDKSGTYVAQLIVNDGVIDSAADTVAISTVNSPPVANAGADINAFVGDTVLLDASSSFDVDGDWLGFTWSLLSQPIGSAAAIADPYAPQTTVMPDLPGLYVAQLVVNDGHVDGVPDTTLLTIEVQDLTAPVIQVLSPTGSEPTSNGNIVVSGSLSERATLTINGIPVTVDQSNQFSQVVTLSEGFNALTLMAVDTAGNFSSVTVYVVLDTGAPAPLDANKVQLNDSGNGTVVVSGLGGSAEVDSSVRITNARTGLSVVVAADAQGTFLALLGAVSGDALQISVIDKAGNIGAARSVNVPSYTGPMTVRIGQPTDGQVVVGNYVVVSGTITEVGDAGVTVNGHIASVARTGVALLFSARIPLEQGVNTMAVQASAMDGRTATQTLTITSVGTVPFDTVVTTAMGIAPLVVEFRVSAYTDAAATALRIDFDGDGTFDSADGDPLAPISHVYAQAGNFLALVEVTDDSGAQHTMQIPIVVESSLQLDGKLRATWSRLMNAFGTGDMATATGMYIGEAAAHYAQILDQLQTHLPDIAASMSAPEPVELSSGFAEYAVKRIIDGESHVFFVDFIQDADGVWRIAGM